MSSVFISYSSSDREFVSRLADDLRTNGFDVWMDQSHIMGQLPYWEEIQTGVEDCTHFLFAISPESVKRESGSMKEVYHAVRHNKIVVLVVVRETPYDSIPMVVGPGMLQIHDFTKLPYEQVLQRVMRALRATQATLIEKVPTVSGNKHGRRSLFGVVIGVVLVAAITAIGLVLNGQREAGGITATAQTLLDVDSTPDPSKSPIAGFNFQTQTASAWTKTPTETVEATKTTSPTSTPVPTKTTPPTATPVGVPTLDAANPRAWTSIVREVAYGDYKVKLVYVPAGEFTMGDDKSDQADERPQSAQQIAQPFWIDVVEVTNEQFKQLDGEAQQISTYTDELRPRETITWEEADRFCRERRGGSLPSELQWEWAARGALNLKYPWGDEWDKTKLVWNRDQAEGSAEVGSIASGTSWIGALDMSGNVWEWTSSIYGAYPYVAEREDQTKRTVERVVRGGSWADGSNISVYRGANRNLRAPTVRQNTIGFRCVLPVEKVE